MMTIGEFERVTGVKRTTVRVYEARGLLTPIERPNGYRAYTQSHVEALEAIKLGQALGFTLKEIKDLTEAWYGGTLGTKQKRAAISGKLHECRAKREQLDQLIRYLEASLDWIDRGEIGEKPTVGLTKKRRD